MSLQELPEENPYEGKINFVVFIASILALISLAIIIYV